MWKYFLADAKGTDVKVNSDKGEDVGLVVATRPHKTFTSRAAFLTNPTYGREMNQDAAFGGTPLLIADGDSTPWTFAQSGTKFTEASTDRAYAGSASVKSAKAPVGDYAEFTNQAGGAGTDIDMTNYVAFSMWINVDNNWTAATEVQFQGVVGAALAGNAVDLSDYFDYAQQDTWHFIIIPMADLGLSTTLIDAVRITQGSKGGPRGPTYYVDVLTLENTGGSIAYSVKPTAGTWFNINVFHIAMVDALAATLASGTMPALSYDKFLGMASNEGLKLEVYRDNVLVSGSSFRLGNLGDMLSMPDAEITNAIGDGTNTAISVERHQDCPMILKSEENDELRVTLEDNFSVLLMMRFSVMGCVETR